MSEKIIQAHIMAAIGSLPDLRVWRNNTGQAWTGNAVLKPQKTTTVTINPGDVLIRRAHPIKFGLPGSADILGIKAPSGQFVAVEVKNQDGRQSEQQKNFQKMVMSMGGLYILAHSAEEAREGLLL